MRIRVRSWWEFAIAGFVNAIAVDVSGADLSLFTHPIRLFVCAIILGGNIAWIGRGIVLSAVSE